MAQESVTDRNSTTVSNALHEAVLKISELWWSLHTGCSKLYITKQFIGLSE